MTPEQVIADALWQKVLDDFGSDKAHDAFLEHCRLDDTLVEAARRYRQHRQSLDPEDSEALARVDKRLKAIAILAMSHIDTHKSDVPSPRKVHRLLAVVAFVILMMALYAAIQALSR